MSLKTKIENAVKESTPCTVENCVFCKIINKEIPSKIIAETEKAMAFLDTFPVSVGHTLVIPKKHFCDLASTSSEYLSAVINLAKFVANTIESTKKLGVWGFNYLSNQGTVAGQVIPHFHLHVIPKYAKNEGMEFKADNKYIDKDIEEVHELLLKTAQKELNNKFEKVTKKNVKKEDETKK